MRAALIAICLLAVPVSSVGGVNPKTGTLRGGADSRRERYIFGW